jgi:hypothetical protein
LNAKASDYDVVAPLVKTQREVVSFGENPIVLSIDYDLDALATAVGNNTAKTGITTAQANAIAANSNKTGITTSQANAITANSAKVSINPITLISNLGQLTNNYSITGRADIDQIKIVTAQNTSATGNSDVSLLVEAGVILCNANSFRGMTGSNGVLQINSRNSGKLKDGAAFRPYNDGNNIINFLNNGNSARGRIDGNNGNNISYRTSSDVRLKENIVDLDSCWELLKTAQPKKYNACDLSLNTFEEDGYCEYRADPF